MKNKRLECAVKQHLEGMKIKKYVNTKDITLTISSFLLKSFFVVYVISHIYVVDIGFISN